MKNKSFFFIIILSLFVMACKEAPKNSKHRPSKNSQIKEKNLDYSISESKVGTFKIGDKIPKTSQVYHIDQTQETRYTESGSATRTIYILSKNNKEHLILVPKNSNHNPKKSIGAIWVLSENYKTTKGIGVNSTLKEFTKAYPNFTLWYTYVSDRYVVQNANTSIQFLLNKNGFIGNKTSHSVKTPLKINDFKKNTRIKKIRVFR